MYKGVSCQVKLFIDVDDTLILYRDQHTWNLKDTDSYRVNYALINALERWQSCYPQDQLIVWSGTGSHWATLIADTFLQNLTIDQTGSKFSSLLHMSTIQDIAIDDRSQDSRIYLKKFGKVFKPEEFIQYVEEDILVEIHEKAEHW